MEAEVTIRKWGNSLGAVFPKEFVKEQKLEENDVVWINVIKKGDLSDMFGSLKMKESAQEFKDFARKGWE